MASAVYGLMLTNIRNDLSDSELVKRIRGLFISIGLQLSGKHRPISLKDSNSGKTVTAFITLDSIRDEYEATRRLQNPTIQQRYLIEDVESHGSLRVEAYNNPRNKYLEQFALSKNTGPKAPSSHHLPSTKDNHRDSVNDIPMYTFGQQLGNETRSVEYKSGQGRYMTQVFRSDLEKYACGYLNSEGGSLLIGVNDKGIVHGVKCSQQEEDAIRLTADQTMKNFKPPVFPDMYTIDFHPVFDKRRKPLVETKIVEVIVSNVKGDELFETHFGDVFLRRDGSTEKMKPHEIQAWTRRRLQGASSGVSMTDRSMEEKKNQELDHLRKSHENLKEEYAVLLKKSTKKSSVCTVL